MLKPSMQDFKHDLTSMGDECNCPMLRTFFGTTFLGMKIDLYICPYLGFNLSEIKFLNVCERCEVLI